MAFPTREAARQHNDAAVVRQAPTLGELDQTLRRDAVRIEGDGIDAAMDHADALRRHAVFAYQMIANEFRYRDHPHAAGHDPIIGPLQSKRSQAINAMECGDERYVGLA